MKSNIIRYYSRKFNKHQFNYSTIEKEALALLLSLQHFKVYVEVVFQLWYTRIIILLCFYLVCTITIST